MLLERKITFKETPLFSINLKFKAFPILLVLILIVLLSLVRPLNLNLSTISLIGFSMMYYLNNLVFLSLYNNFEDIKKSSRNLEESKEVISCFGSSDREMIDLSKTLSETARHIFGAREKERKLRKDLQEKLEELQKWYVLTVGREKKMLELQEKVTELKKKPKK